MVYNPLKWNLFIQCRSFVLSMSQNIAYVFAGGLNNSIFPFVHLSNFLEKGRFRSKFRIDVFLLHSLQAGILRNMYFVFMSRSLNMVLLQVVRCFPGTFTPLNFLEKWSFWSNLIIDVFYFYWLREVILNNFCSTFMCLFKRIQFSLFTFYSLFRVWINILSHT